MTGAKTPAEILQPGEGTTPMLFPMDLMLNLGGTFVKFPAGIVEVPNSVADVQKDGKSTGLHWYLKAAGVKPYSAPTYPPKKPFKATADHLTFAKKAGLDVDSVEALQKFVDALGPEQKAAFLKDFEDDVPPSQPPKTKAQDPPKLDKMSKADLATHAKEVHGLDLNPKETTKEDMIAAIDAAQNAAKK